MATLFLSLGAFGCANAGSAGGESTLGSCDERPALGEDEESLELPGATQGCVEYRSRLVHAATDDAWFVDTTVCNACDGKIALRTLEERGEAKDVKVEATDYSRFIGQVQVTTPDGRWSACPLLQTDQERHFVAVDATIPADEALHHRAAIEAWRRLDGTDGGRPSGVETVFHALPPAGSVSEEGDRLSVGEPCTKSFDELDLSGPVVSADMPSELAAALAQ